MLAGGMAGFCQIIITTPMELLKIQMQSAGTITTESTFWTKPKPLPKASALQLARGMIREKGFFGLYQGITPTMARDVLFSIVYFPLFATLNQLGPRKASDANEAEFYVSFLAGCVAGSTSAVAVNPFDVVKTRMQATRLGQVPYTGMLDCFK